MLEFISKKKVYKFSGFYSSCDQMVVFLYVSELCNG